MNFREQVDQARQQLELASVEHNKAIKALTEAATRYGILTGAYRGLAAFDEIADTQVESDADEQGSPGGETSQIPGKRAPKGSGKRRAMQIITANNGISSADIAAAAEQTGDPIPSGTLRRALADLVLDERIRKVDDLWYAMVRDEIKEGDEAAGSGEGAPAASDSNSQMEEARDGPALTPAS